MYYESTPDSVFSYMLVDVHIHAGFHMHILRRYTQMSNKKRFGGQSASRVQPVSRERGRQYSHGRGTQYMVPFYRKHAPELSWVIAVVWWLA